MTSTTANTDDGTGRADWPATRTGEGAWATAAPVNASKDRRGRRRAQKINDLLRMTAICIAEHGYHGMNLDEVADRLDVSKASLYHYFTGKEDLVYETLETCATYVRSRLDEVAAGPGDPAVRLRALVVSQLEMTVRDYPEMAHLFLHPVDWPDALRTAVKTWRDEHNAIFSRVISEGIASGDLHSVDPNVSRTCLYGALNYIPMWLTNRPAGFEDILDKVVDTTLALFGLGTLGRNGPATAP